MLLIETLYTTLTIVIFVNAIMFIYIYWPRVKMDASEKVEPNKNDAAWTWKDTIWFILMIIAVVLLTFIALFSFSVLKMRLLVSVIAVSYFLEQITRSISSAETVGNIVRGKASKMLKKNDYTSIITIAILVTYVRIYGILDKVIEYADHQTNTIFSDWILLGFYVGTIAITIFFICSLSLKPIQITIELVRKIFSRFSNQKAPKLFSVLKKQANGTYPQKSLTASLVEYIIKQHGVFCRILWLSVPIVIILDILGMTGLLAYGIVVSIVWYLLSIAISIGKIISKIADRILLLSDRNVVAISFRISIILGLGCTVLINQYEPFLLNQESTSAFEFISSTIIIPVILEWVVSYKTNIKKEIKTQKS